MNEEQVRILKLHKRWADRYTLSWLGFAVLLLTGFQFVLDRAGIEAADPYVTFALSTVSREVEEPLTIRQT